MELVRDIFNDRVKDIESYFELVNNIELAVGAGTAVFNVNGAAYQVTPDQQKIMYSGIYLHLYNLVESTVSTLLEAVERHASEGIGNELGQLTQDMRILYVKSVVGSGESLSPEKRLEKAMGLFEQVLEARPVQLKIPPGGGGNWDSQEISKISKNIGINIQLPDALNTLINQPIRNDMAPLWLIKSIRNKLAHGSLSFTECGENHVAGQFRKLINIVKEYLSHIIDSYDHFIVTSGYKVAQ